MLSDKLYYRDFVFELNITELCNLQCPFCPRAQDYPNQNLHMSMDTVKEIISQVEGFLDRYQDVNSVVIDITGRGEPTLHKNFRKLMKEFIAFSQRHPRVSLKCNTNAYKFDRYYDLFQQVDTMSINLYHNFSKEEFFEFKEKYQHNKNFLIHYRKLGEEIIQGSKKKVDYNNRSGSILIPVTEYGMPNEKRCHKPFQGIMIDWNGDYNLCCNDWDPVIALNNIYKSPIVEYFVNDPLLNEYRDKLKVGDRSMTPCDFCNSNSARQKGFIEWVNNERV